MRGTTVAVHEPSTTAVPVDLQLIDAMIADHTAAIAMANIGLERANDSLVYRMALRIAESQAGELQLLRHWRTIWFPNAPDTGVIWPETTARSIDILCSEDDSTFDRVFFVQMIEHHTAAIEMVGHVLDDAQHAELREFAAAIIDARHTEVAMMQSWLMATNATPSPAGSPAL